MQFKDLNIIPAILNALEKEHYQNPTPIQEQAIPSILAGKDLLGCAQTGTGKTAAFAIPTIQLLTEQGDINTGQRKIQALVLTPTRELAMQIYESFRTYGQNTNLRYSVIFGGVSQKPQEQSLKYGVDIVIATPGRLNDLINQKKVDLSHLKILILDEADRMLDMGFIIDVKKIIAKTPNKRQTLFFSATMPPEILKLSSSILVNPVKVAITPISSTVDTIKQFIYFVDKENKMKLLLHILKDQSIYSAIVFTRTKHGADKVVRELTKAKVTALAIHGNKSQNNRQVALKSFKENKIRILVATDIAARGIDIDELSHVINYDVPNESETYVHRIGRTGRAGLSGTAITLCEINEMAHLNSIEKLIGKRITDVNDHPYPMLIKTLTPKVTTPKQKFVKTFENNSVRKSYKKQTTNIK